MQYNKIFLQTKNLNPINAWSTTNSLGKSKDEFIYSNKKYIDFTSTIFVSNIGHSNKNLIKSIKNSFKTLNSHLLVFDQ